MEHFQKGFTLIELLVVVILVAVVGILASQSLHTMSKTQKNYQDHEGADYEIMSMIDLIRRVGRVAQTCAKVVVAGTPQLRCQIDLNHPPTGVFTFVRFLLVGNSLQYQSDKTGGAWTGATSTIQSASNIASFIVCDDTDMAGSGAACPIIPAEISKVHSANLAGGKAGRFFRYQIVESLTQVQNTFQASFQAAFFVRNSNPMALWWKSPPGPATNSASYSW